MFNCLRGTPQVAVETFIGRVKVEVEAKIKAKVAPKEYSFKVVKCLSLCLFDYYRPTVMLA